MPQAAALQNSSGNASLKLLKLWLIGLVLTAVTLIVLLFVSNAAFHNPAPADAEFVFTFRVYGEWISGAAVASPDDATDTRPVHMRTPLPKQRTRSPVLVRVTVDGHHQEHIYQPKGFKSDGTSVGELRVPLTPGTHRISVTVSTSANPAVIGKTWSNEVNSVAGRLTVLTLESGHEFEFAP